MVTSFFINNNFFIQNSIVNGKLSTVYNKYVVYDVKDTIFESNSQHSGTKS